MSLPRLVSLGACAVLLTGGLLVAQAVAPAPAQAAVVVANGSLTGPIASFPIGMGQLVTVPAEQDVMSSLTMRLSAVSAASSVHFEVYAWDAAAIAPAGPLLGTSSTVLVTSGSTVATTFTWSGLAVVPGNQYLIIVRADNALRSVVKISTADENYTLGGGTWVRQPFTHTDQITYLQTPTITALSEQTGMPGDTMTVTGTGFADATAVAFDGVAAPAFTVDSDTQLTVTVPPGIAAGSTVDVRVTSDTLLSATSAATAFTVPAPGAATTSTPSDPALAYSGLTLSPLPIIVGALLLLTGALAMLVAASPRRGARLHGARRR